MLLMIFVFLPVTFGSNIKTLNEMEPVSNSSNNDIDWWPMFHHDSQHTGYSTSKVEDYLFNVWRFKTGGPILGSPVVVDYKVYIGSLDNNIYCLDVVNGQLIWSTDLGSDLLGSPTVVDGKVYIGSIYNHKVYCLDADYGNVIWTYKTGGNVYSSPVVDSGMVYIGAYDGKLYCLNATNGEFIWSFKIGDIIVSSPTVAYDMVYLASASANSRMMCFNAKTGEIIWTRYGLFVATSVPAIYNNKVYVNTFGQTFYCLNAFNGSTIWTNKKGGSSSSPAVFEDKLYIGCGFKVYCFNATNGEVIWTYETEWDVSSSPGIADGKVYVGSDDDKFYCLNASNGELLWRFNIGSNMRYSSPAIANGMAFIGSENGYIYAFKSDNTPPRCSIVKPSKNHLYICNKEKRSSLLNLVFGKINISVDAVDDISGIKEVNFYINGVFKGEGVLNPDTGFYEWALDETLFGMCKIRVEAVDMVDMFSSDKINVLYFNIRGLCG